MAPAMTEPINLQRSSINRVCLLIEFRLQNSNIAVRWSKLGNFVIISSFFPLFSSLIFPGTSPHPHLNTHLHPYPDAHADAKSYYQLIVNERSLREYFFILIKVLFL